MDEQLDSRHRSSLASMVMVGLVLLQATAAFGEESWSILRGYGNTNLHAIDMLDPNYGLAVGASGSVLEWDGSKFTRLYDVTESSGILSSVGVLAPGEAYIGSRSGTSGVFHWDGLTSEQVRTAQTRSIWAASADNVWAGTRDALIHYDGSSWTNVYSDSRAVFSGVHGHGDSIWAVSGSGVHHSLNAGANWSTAASPALEGTLWLSVHAISPHEAWFAGEGGKVARWDGTGYSSFALDTGEALNSVVARSSTDVWAAGANGALFHYNGSAWSAVDLGLPTGSQAELDFTSITTTADGALWLAGERGFLFHYGESAPPIDRSSTLGWDFVRSNPFTIMGNIGTTSVLADNAATFREAGFNGMNITGTSDPLVDIAQAAGLGWTVGGNIDNFERNHTKYAANLYKLPDEPSLNQIEEVALRAEVFRRQFPDVPIYVNLFPMYATAEQLQTRNSGEPYDPNYTYTQYVHDFVTTVKPDILMYDFYPFVDAEFTPEAMRPHYFENMMIIREHALAAGIPYWGYMQAFDDPHGIGWRGPSESDMRMQAYSMLAAGFTGLDYWTYYRASPDRVFLVDSDGAPTPLYGYAQGVNAEVANLGKWLTQLISTDVWFVAGQDAPGEPDHATPAGLTALTADTARSLVDVEVLTFGSGADGLLGMFEDEAGHEYFMLTNLLHGEDLTSEQTQLSFLLTFDEDVASLIRLDRVTGEEVSVFLDDGQLVLTLPGGTGDLFRIVAVPEPTTGLTCLVLFGAIAARRPRGQLRPRL